MIDIEIGNHSYLENQRALVIRLTWDFDKTFGLAEEFV